MSKIHFVVALFMLSFSRNKEQLFQLMWFFFLFYCYSFWIFLETERYILSVTNSKIELRLENIANISVLWENEWWLHGHKCHEFHCYWMKPIPSCTFLYTLLPWVCKMRHHSSPTFQMGKNWRKLCSSTLQQIFQKFNFQTGWGKKENKNLPTKRKLPLYIDRKQVTRVRDSEAKRIIWC